MKVLSQLKQVFDKFGGRNLRSWGVLLLMVMVLGIVSDRFLTLPNIRNILLQISVNLCLSVGMTMVILSGGIDLSVGAVLALAGAMAAGCLKWGVCLPGSELQLEFTVSGAILVAVLVGIACGSINGLVITKLGLPPFIATLAMLSIARGLTMLWTKGFPITGLGHEFGYIGTGAPLGVPMPVWISLSIALLFHVVLVRTRFGRYIYAVGGNERAAVLTGLNVNRIKLLVYTITGALAGVAGLIVTARLDAADPNAGMTYELDSIAAVVIGGTSLSGGRGSITGTILGCLIIGVLQNGLFLLNVSPFWQQVIKGGVILLAVALDRFGRKS